MTAIFQNIRGTLFPSFKIGRKTGPTIYQGAISPTSDIGVSGDFYIQPNGNNSGVYINQGGTWNKLIASNNVGSLIWNDIEDIDTDMIPNNGYVSRNSALSTFTLPETIEQGEIVAVSGTTTGGWQISQNAGQTVHFGFMDSTPGITGLLQSSYKYDYIELLCIIANTDFIVKASVGNITIL